MIPFDGEGDVLMASSGNISIPKRIQDNREPYEKKRAVYFILLTTFLERMAFNAFTLSLFAILLLDEAFGWSDQNGKTASYIFAGKSLLSSVFA